MKWTEEEAKELSERLKKRIRTIEKLMFENIDDLTYWYRCQQRINDLKIEIMDLKSIRDG